MKSLVYRLFCLYEGEGRQALLLVGLALGWAIGAYGGLTLADGLFLEHLGARWLPQAYLYTALSLLSLATLSLTLFSHFLPYRLFLMVLGMGALGYALIISLLFYVQEQGLPGGFWLFFKVFANCFFVVLTSSYWLFIDQYYSFQKAKRLYSLFNTAIFLGNCCGATLLSCTLNALGICGLLLLLLLLLVMAAGNVAYIHRHLHSLRREETEEETPPARRTSLKALAKSLIASRFTLFLILTYLFLQLLNSVTEYRYMEGIAHYFASGLGAGQLTIFLGKWSAWIALFNVFFGLFFYSRLVRRLGVNNIVLLSPLFFFSLFWGWSFSSLLFFSILGLFVVEGISYLFDENNANLLLNAVPSEWKHRIRIALDSFFEPLGMLCSALLFFVNGLNPVLLGLFLSFTVLVLVFSLRAQYRPALLLNLSKNAFHFERKAGDWIALMSKREKRLAEFRLMAILRQRDEPSQLFAFEVLLHFGDLRLLPRLLNHFNRLSIRAKLKAIQLLERCPFSRQGLVLSHLSSWMDDASPPALKQALLFYFAKKGLLPPKKIIQDLKSSDVHLRAAAILAMKKGTQLFSLASKSVFSNYSNQESLDLLPQERAQHLQRLWSYESEATISFHCLQASLQLQQLLSSSKEEELALALSILEGEESPKSADLLVSFLTHPSLLIARQAIRALLPLIGPITPHLSSPLLDLLKQTNDSSLRLECLQGLGKIQDTALVSVLIPLSLHFRPAERRKTEEILSQLGQRIVPTLLCLVQEDRLNDRCRLLAARILDHLAPPQLRSHLVAIVRNKIDIAHLYFYHAYLSAESPLLGNALLASFHSTIDFIIQLLGICGSIENSEVLVYALRSRNPKVRSHAVETVEKACEKKIFRHLQPLIDDRPLEDKLRLYLKSKRPLLSREELLDIIGLSSSPLSPVIALALQSKDLVMEKRPIFESIPASVEK